MTGSVSSRIKTHPASITQVIINNMKRMNGLLIKASHFFNRFSIQTPYGYERLAE
jgi:hypothetical protein